MSPALVWLGGAFTAGYVTFLSFGPEMLKAHGLGVLAAASIDSVGSRRMIGSGAICGQIAGRLGHTNRILAVTMSVVIIALLLLSVPGAGLGASLLFGLVGMAPAKGDHRAGGSGGRGRTAGLRHGCFSDKLLCAHNSSTTNGRLDL